MKEVQQHAHEQGNQGNQDGTWTQKTCPGPGARRARKILESATGAENSLGIVVAVAAQVVAVMLFVFLFFSWLRFW